MTKSLTIDKNKILKPSQDYDLLRELGIEYIQQLSGKIWTDYNLHDPGITTLELLCYALTDLGYRTDFAIEDILTTQNGQESNPEVSSFFPAESILTNSALTIYDYRTLLLKIEGVKNAWFDTMSTPGPAENEVDIYIDCYRKKLSDKNINDIGNENKQLYLSGLYQVLLEFDIDDDLGSLNESDLNVVINGGFFKSNKVEVSCADTELLEGEIDFSLDFLLLKNVLYVSDANGKFTYSVDFELADNSIITLSQFSLFIINHEGAEKAKIIALLLDDEVNQLVRRFWKKQQLISQIMGKVCCALQANRNLCEDFYSIKTVDSELIGICVDIEVTSDTDLEKIQAQVVFAIEQYLNPPIDYHSLKELLDEDYCVDDVFNGPCIDYDFSCNGENVFTKPGFIKRETLQKSELKTAIYTSDIINILMDIKGVVSLKDLRLKKFDGDGNQLGETQKWCLDISKYHQPRLDIHSPIIFYKNGIQYDTNQREFTNTLTHLRAMAQKNAIMDLNQTLIKPFGSFRDTNQHFTVQNDFPETYGVGIEGLEMNVPVDRVIKAKQFKAYLLFFDQLLADYLSQLSNIPTLFSLSDSVKQTYFSQYLSDIPGVRELFEDEAYLDKSFLQNVDSRTSLNEDEVLFLERRGRVLDHLVARFAEKLTDYGLMMHDVSNDVLKTDQQLIIDKSNFLKNYPVFSRERNKAFNYSPENVSEIWDTDNVSGLQKRQAGLSGMENYFRRNLACASVFDELFDTDKEGVKFRLVLKSETGQPFFVSDKLFSTRPLAMKDANKIYPHIHNASTYKIDTSGGVGQVSLTLNVDGLSLLSKIQYADYSQALQNVKNIISAYDELLQSDLLYAKGCGDEGMYLFEHILFRPVAKNSRLMHVCIDDECLICGDEDPYSFRISVVLPYWPKRFQKIGFRQYFEKTIREQCPAHIQVKVCWVDNEDMLALQKKYRQWLIVKAKGCARNQKNKTQLINKSNELIEVLESLKTVYPTATLHDCQDDSGSNPIKLGSTNLGIF